MAAFTRRASRIRQWHGRKLKGWGGGGGVSSFLSAVQFVGGNHFNASQSRQSVLLPVVFSLGLSVILCMDLRRCACLSGILTFAHMLQMAGSSQEMLCSPPLAIGMRKPATTPSIAGSESPWKPWMLCMSFSVLLLDMMLSHP